MIKVIFSGIVMLLLINMVAAAGDIPGRFRLGWVVSAEISRRAVTVLNQNPYAFKEPENNKAYAIISVKLDSGRTLSIHDFSLIVSGNKYPCVALRTGISDFNAENWQILETSPKDIYSMLFIVDCPDLESGKEIKLNLKYNIVKSQSTEYSIPFKNLNNADFTPVVNLLTEDAPESQQRK